MGGFRLDYNSSTKTFWFSMVEWKSFTKWCFYFLPSQPCITKMSSKRSLEFDSLSYHFKIIILIIMCQDLKAINLRYMSHYPYSLRNCVHLCALKFEKLQELNISHTYSFDNCFDLLGKYCKNLRYIKRLIKDLFFINSNNNQCDNIQYINSINIFQRAECGFLWSNHRCRN